MDVLGFCAAAARACPNQQASSMPGRKNGGKEWDKQLQLCIPSVC